MLLIKEEYEFEKVNPVPFYHNKQLLFEGINDKVYLCTFELTNKMSKTSIMKVKYVNKITSFFKEICDIDHRRSCLLLKTNNDKSLKILKYH